MLGMMLSCVQNARFSHRSTGIEPVTPGVGDHESINETIPHRLYPKHSQTMLMTKP